MYLRLLVALLLCISISEAKPLGTLKGHILNPYGSGATESQIRVVQWYFENGEPRVTYDRVTYTDSNGDFSLQVPPGIYDVFVSRVDSEPIGKKLKIVSDKTTSFNAKLKASPVAEFVE
jgi:hypothetical protein